MSSFIITENGNAYLSDGQAASYRNRLYFLSHVQYWPDSVDVYTFEEKLDSINVIYTEPLNYVGFRDTLMITCKTSHPKDVKVVPDQVRIGFYTDVLTEESLDGVPIQAINMPPGKCCVRSRQRSGSVLSRVSVSSAHYVQRISL